MFEFQPGRRFIAFIRVSTTRQADEGVSLDAQRQQIEGQVALWGGKVVEWVVEDGVSAKSKTHMENIQKVIRWLEEDKADGLVVYSFDRLARSAHHLLHILDRARVVGKSLCSLREQFDTSTPHGEFAVAIIGAAGKLEQRMIGERTKEAFRFLKSDGRAYCGRVPYGLRIEVRGKKRYFVPDEQQVKVLRLIAEWRAVGGTWREIADRLNAENIPTAYKKNERINPGGARYNRPPPKKSKWDTGAWTQFNVVRSLEGARKRWPEFDAECVKLGLDEIKRITPAPTSTEPEKKEITA